MKAKEWLESLKHANLLICGIRLEADTSFSMMLYFPELKFKKKNIKIRNLNTYDKVQFVKPFRAEI